MNVSIGLARHILAQGPNLLNAWWGLMQMRAQPNCLEKFRKDRLANVPMTVRRRNTLIKTCINQGWLRTDGKGNFFPVGSDTIFKMYCGGHSCAAFEVPLFDTPRKLQDYLCGVLIQALANQLRYKRSEARKETREPVRRSIGAPSAPEHSHIAVSLKLIESFIGCSYKNAYQLRKKACESGLVSFTRQFSNFSVLENVPQNLIGRAKESMNPEDAKKIIRFKGNWCIECSSLCTYKPLSYVRRKFKSDASK